MLLNKTWFRVVVSLFVGGGVSEFIHVFTGDPNRPQTTNLSLLYAIAICIFLTLWAKNHARKEQ
ncbi:hypothetical protein [Chryseolinea lacunae]|uniref:Holin n=1 Tax=Chryseolinea lacunae TaxID=2801331 RepID=A0ABS1KNY1_9BACT|nr:hypothetical protein [Chryseolinea lacunae]MBL0741164.1 hypothetical protein [Chryseolinea lacunae]